MKLGQLIEYNIMKTFMEKISRECASETSFRPLFDFDEQLGHLQKPFVN